MVELMKWVSRSELGWPASAAPDQASTSGVKVHYEGSPVSNATHADCVEEVKAIRRSHLANTKENYSDIAYNLLVCRHGYVFEGRGKGKRTGANGDQPLNRAHYAVCVLLGDKGDTQPTDDMINGVRDAIGYLRDHGAGSEIKGHRDGYATACPGEPMYLLVKNGSLEPAKHEDPKPVPPKPTPIYATYPGASFFKIGKRHPLIAKAHDRLVAVGCNKYRSQSDKDQWGSGDKASYAAWQRKLGYSGSAADGVPGKASWDKLRVPKP